MISQHRTEALKVWYFPQAFTLCFVPPSFHYYTTVLSPHPSQDSDQYRVVSEVRGQLKVLESIDRLNHKRKQEREKEKILRAAKSRSKVEDPEAAAKIKEQAKQVRAVLQT